MNMNINNINTTKLISHATTISQIKIPMIQRDYVQGLEENNNKLDRFLDALYNIINSNNINDILSLDFIYGKINNDGIFEPIDGQQRLTTLALLNFYFFCKQENNTYVQNAFEYITYTTRQSAEKFCKILSSKDFIKHFKSNISNKQPSSIINEYHKYFKEYNEDTTIIAMVNTLDKIHNKFKNLETYKYKNINRITFKILPMNNFKLSDDLYIKMNGRGKQLSNFDNFKADYFKWLENEQHNLSELSPDNMDIETLKNKFNTDYIDIFWDFAVRDDNEQIPDPESLFFRFINRFITGKILNKINTKETNKDLKENITEYIKQQNSKKSQQPSSEDTEDNVEIETQVEQFLYDMQEYFFDNNGAKTENNTIIYSKFDFYEFILQTYNENLINILENIHNNKNILEDYFTSSWNEHLSIMDDFDYKKLFIYNTTLSFLEYNIYQNDSAYKKELEDFSRLVWNVAEQYHFVEGINRNTYNSIANRFNFLTNNNNSINYDTIYSKFIEHNKNYNITGNLKTIIHDEIKKITYFVEYIEDKKTIIINTEKLSMIRTLESLQFIKGGGAFLLSTDSNNHKKISLDDKIKENAVICFSEKNRYKEFLRALISSIKTSKTLLNTKYQSNKVLDQLITKENIKKNANHILNNENIIVHIKKQYNEKSPLDNIIDYERFTFKCQHEGLYKYDDIDKYKIYITYRVAWLLTIDGNTAKNDDMRSYCPIRNSLIYILKNLGKDKIQISSLYSKKYCNIPVLNDYSLNFDAYSINIIYKNNYVTHINLNSIIDNNMTYDINKNIIKLYETLIERTSQNISLQNLSEHLALQKDNSFNLIKNLKHEINPFEQ